MGKRQVIVMLMKSYDFSDPFDYVSIMLVSGMFSEDEIQEAREAFGALPTTEEIAQPLVCDRIHVYPTEGEEATDQFREEVIELAKQHFDVTRVEGPALVEELAKKAKKWRK